VASVIETPHRKRLTKPHVEVPPTDRFSIVEVPVTRGQHQPDAGVSFVRSLHGKLPLFHENLRKLLTFDSICLFEMDVPQFWGWGSSALLQRHAMHLHLSCSENGLYFVMKPDPWQNVVHDQGSPTA
jgi:hypothetical protein